MSGSLFLDHVVSEIVLQFLWAGCTQPVRREVSDANCRRGSSWAWGVRSQFMVAALWGASRDGAKSALLCVDDEAVISACGLGLYFISKAAARLM
jgi:hypothetical protein